MNAIGEAILQNLNTLIVVIDPNGDVSYTSPSVQRLLGFQTKQLLGNGWWELPRASAEEGLLVKKQILSVIHKSDEIKIPVFEREIFTSSGEKKVLIWHSNLADDGSLVGIGYDITERKRTENLLADKIKELQVKNAEMLESIAYAQRIQQSILANPEGLSEHLSDSFIYYQPKDIVSGDLYWYYKKENKLYIAAIDCTGHGVPGALMSVIANGLLRTTIVKRNLMNPAEILWALDEELQSALLTQGTADGMDIALIELNLDNKEVKFSGAFRPLVLVRNGKITEFKASKYPIGLYAGIEKKFELNTFRLQTGDTLYIFSDGYADQFGGERNKKFNRRNFYEMLLSIQEMNLSEQGSFLEYAHHNWKQDEPQTDDILVMGLRI